MQIQHHPIDALRLKTACSSCSLRELCLPVGLTADELRQLDNLVEERRRIKRGGHLYTAASAFDALYTVRLGSFKTSVLIEDGREQVTGFHMLGDMMGLDGISNDTYNCSAVALEDSEVCVMQFGRMEEYARTFHTLQHHVHRLLSREVVREQQSMMMLGTMRAEEKLASFLLDLSARYVQRGYSASEFVLRMTREEIGSYLGLKLETVSRLFSRFQDAGLVLAQQKYIKILDRNGLKDLIGVPD
jgi:CRP/FNR family transcriptional regulator